MTHYTCQLSWWVNFLSPTNYRVIVTKILIGLVVGDIILACFDQKVMNDVLVLRTSMHGMAILHGEITISYANDFYEYLLFF
jgi:hypothetical protein